MEVKIDPKFGGQWNVPKPGGRWNVLSLVANGIFQAWWPMEGEGKTPFHLFPLFPLFSQQTLLKFSIFSFDLKVLLYHGSRPLFMPFLPFL